MGDQFLGEIRMVGFNFAPVGWALCDGSLLSIQQNAALFSLLGVTFGGNGTTNFALPDLRGRTPVCMGSGLGLEPITLGEQAGSESTTISQAQMPTHTHALNVAGTPTNSDNAPTSKNNVLGAAGTGQGSATIWSTALSSPVALNQGQIGVAGGNLPLPLRNPYLGTNFIIALTGVFPSRT
jgi:microcystin-dependent protein